MFQMLGGIAQQYAIRLLYTAGPVDAAVIEQWPSPAAIKAGAHGRAKTELDSLRLWTAGNCRGSRGGWRAPGPALPPLLRAPL